MKRPAAQMSSMLAASLAASPVAAQVYGDGVGMWHGTWGWGHMVVGGLMMLLFWAAVIALIVLIVRWLSGSAREQRPPDRSALEILEERFARGEIEREEFEEKRRLLAGQAGAQKGR